MLKTWGFGAIAGLSNKTIKDRTGPAGELSNVSVYGCSSIVVFRRAGKLVDLCRMEL